MRIFCLTSLFSLSVGCVWVSESDWEARVDADGDGAFALRLGGTDCDDTNPEVRPGAVEVCNGIDDNCDDDVDGGLVRLRYLRDADQDGFGTPSDEQISCAEPAGYVQVDVGDPEDCDDTRAEVYPGAADVWYDGIDSNCDGANDYDQDGDGYANLASGGQDCDDLDLNRSPDAAEIWYDGIDQDCDGGSDFDQDGDGIDLDEDCNDTDDTIFPGAEEIWYDDINQNCDQGSDFDQDGDGSEAVQGFGSDCDDTDATVFPGAEEIWYDGVDQNCDEADDYDRDGDGYQSDQYGGTDCDDTTDNVGPDEGETCNERDDDCNGLVDDIDTYWRDADGDGAGLDSDTIIGCVVPDGYVEEGRLADVDCDDTDPTTYPGAPVVCGDWVDNDCGNDTELCGGERPIWPWVELNGALLQHGVGTPGDITGDGVLDLWTGGLANLNPQESARIYFQGFAGPFPDGGWGDELWTLTGNQPGDGAWMQSFAIDLGGPETQEVVVYQRPVPSQDETSEDREGYVWLLVPADIPPGNHAFADYVAEEIVLPVAPNAINDVGPLPSASRRDLIVARDGDLNFAIFEGLPSSASAWGEAEVFGSWDYSPSTFLSAFNMGDVDGDGVDDLVVGVPWFHGAFDGATLLTLGPLPPTLVLPLDTDARLDDPTHEDGTGGALCLLDFNGDGRLDVADPGSLGPRDELRAYVGTFEVGVPHPANNVASVLLPSNEIISGLNVGCVGDLNGDGADDLMVGSPSASDHEGITVALFGPSERPVYNLNTAPEHADLLILGDGSTEGGTGAGFHTVGDMDGDGVDDAVVAERPNGGGTSGLWLFRGKAE